MRNHQPLIHLLKGRYIMTKKISVVLAIIMLLTCVFAACGSKSTDITGTWAFVNDESTIFSFDGNGGGYAETDGIKMDLTYTIKGDEITINLDGTSALEEMTGMTMEEIEALGVLSEEDLAELKTTETFPFELKGDTLYLDGDACKKVN